MNSFFLSLWKTISKIVVRLCLISEPLIAKKRSQQLILNFLYTLYLLFVWNFFFLPIFSLSVFSVFEPIFLCYLLQIRRTENGSNVFSFVWWNSLLVLSLMFLYWLVRAIETHKYYVTWTFWHWTRNFLVSVFTCATTNNCVQFLCLGQMRSNHFH